MGDNYWRAERVRLRAVEPGDWETHYSWDQDATMTRSIDYIWFPGSEARARQWASGEATRDPTDDSFRFEIENQAGELVGSIDTHHCNRRVGTFSYGVGIRAEHQRRGYASEAIVLVCHYYFEEQRYQKVFAEVFSFNAASIGLHERLGFQREGCLRRMVYTGGSFYDTLVYGMTAEEFAAMHGVRAVGLPLDPDQPAGS